MADYYTKFSVVIPFNDEQKRYARELFQASCDIEHLSQREALPIELQTDDYIEALCWEFHPVDEGIWITSGDCSGAGLESAMMFMQHLLHHFNDDGTIVFEWSNDCSKPRPDGYGGGAARITKDEIETVSTGEIANRWAMQPGIETVRKLAQGQGAS